LQSPVHPSLPYSSASSLAVLRIISKLSFILISDVYDTTVLEVSLFKSVLREHKVFVIVVVKTDDPSTIRFLQGITSANLVMSYEVHHVYSPPMGKDRVFEPRPHSSSLDVGLVSLLA
jgi:hypothetical protein